jgi:hypothetical protein
MRIIEQEISCDGSESRARTKITVQEVLRTAGFRSPALLEKSRHRSLKVELRTWIERINRLLLSQRETFKSSLRRRTTNAEAEVRAMMQMRAEAEFEINTLVTENYQQNQRILELENIINACETCSKRAIKQ